MGSGSSSQSPKSGDYFKNYKFKGYECKIYYGKEIRKFLNPVSEQYIQRAIKNTVNTSRITKIELWKVPLAFVQWLPSDFGLFFHAYLVFKTNEGNEILSKASGELYWSFEKNAERIHLQLSHEKRNVVEDFDFES